MVEASSFGFGSGASTSGSTCPTDSHDGSMHAHPISLTLSLASSYPSNLLSNIIFIISRGSVFHLHLQPQEMSYQHIHHPPQEFGGPFPSAVPPPPGFPYDAPPPPPPPRPGPGYQDYFSEGYNQPPPPTSVHTHHYSHGNDFQERCWAFCRGCCAALCCCCMLEECCL